MAESTTDKQKDQEWLNEWMEVIIECKNIEWVAEVRETVHNNLK